MTKEEELKKGLKGLAQVPIQTFAAKVLEVDEENDSLTALPLDGRPRIFDVRLTSIITNQPKGFRLIPRIDSDVLIGIIGNDKDTAFLLLSYDIEKIKIDLEGIKLEVKDGVWSWNEGSNGGLMKIDQVLSDLNSLKSDLNTLKNVFTAWVPVPQDGGAALKTAIASWSGQTFTPSQKSDWENEKIKH